jgi:glycosyltransferase involved in cell wall biosynthesis
VRVVVNQLVALRQKSGVGHYTAQLLRCLQEKAGEDRVDGFPAGWLARACQGKSRPARKKPGHGGPRRGRLGRTVDHWKGRCREVARQCGQAFLSRCLQTSCNRWRYDLYHEPNYLPLVTDRPTVATFHDLSVLLHPAWHPADRVAYYERYLPGALDRCVHFLTVSEFSRQEMIRTLGLPADRVTRTYNGIRPELRPLPAAEVAETLRRLGLPPRYLLSVGTIEPRKNLLVLLRAYCALPAPLRNRWPLLLVGGWGWNTADVAEYFHHVARHRGVLHVGYLGDDDLVAVYNGARALVYPSLYEGFGLPPLEMMACGGAVLASTAGAVVETVGARADLVPPEDLDGWYKALTRVLKDDDWWHSLRDGAEDVARPFTWERCAAETMQVYRKLCGVAEPELPSRKAA